MYTEIEYFAGEQPCTFATLIASSREQPCTSATAIVHISSLSLRPLPAAIRESSSRGQKRKSAIIATSSPHKAEQAQVSFLLKQCYEKAATIANATKGFSEKGIFPLNMLVFSDADFACSYDREKRTKSNCKLKPRTANASACGQANTRSSYGNTI